MYQFKKNIVYFTQILINLVCLFIRIIPIKNNRIFIMSYHGKNLSGNPKYIATYILENYPELQVIIGSYTPIDKFKTVKPDFYNPKYLYYMLTSKFWIDNCRKTFPILKRRNQIYIQTWHGTPLKKIEFDVEHALSELYLSGAKLDSKMIDYFISPNQFVSDLIPDTFKFFGKILECGYPRNDILINLDEEKKNLIKQQLGLKLDKKIILYGPTFRDSHKNSTNFSNGLNIDFGKFCDYFGEEYILLLRLHSNVASDIKINQNYSHIIYDVSQYPDSQELLAITDLLITDYSSLFFDFATTKRPMVFYAHDLKIYQDKLRGFYFDYENFVPGPIVYNMDELFNVIKNEEKYYDFKYYHNLEVFCKRFTTFENGEASQKISELIMNIYREG